MKVKKNLILPLIPVLITLFMGCSTQREFWGEAEADYMSENVQFFEEQNNVSLSKLAVREIEYDQEENQYKKGEQDQNQKRKKIYNSEISLIVEDVEETKSEIESHVNSIEGLITNIQKNSIIIKVPVEHFDSTFEMIQNMGDVLDKNIFTFDVTDYYSDTEAQLNTAILTRERLQTLLKRSSDPQERSRILNEISRLTEEIESIKSRLATLENNISFSTISVYLEPRLASGAISDSVPFQWIRNINPTGSVSYTLKGSVKYNPGGEFAVFDKSDIYYAENSAGLTIKISTVENRPDGDNEFWRKALKHYVSGYYKTSAEKDFTFGKREVMGLEFLSKDAKPFKYFIGVVVIKDKIGVIEIFSPDGSVDFNSIYSSFESGVIK